MLQEAMRRGQQKTRRCAGVKRAMDVVLAEMRLTVAQAQQHVSSVIEDGGQLCML
jgi:hypothetical protein|eukprot:COSAG01_NODE_27656_length_680_cov_0.981067_2_plen_55_part_00